MKTGKFVLWAGLSLLLVSALPAVSQRDDAKTEEASAVALLQLVQCSLAGRCVEAGSIASEYEGVQEVKVNTAYSELIVTYDPKKTTPKKLVDTFNRENPGSRLEVVDAARSEAELKSHRRWFCHYRVPSDII